MPSIYRDKPYRVTQPFGRTSFDPNHVGLDTAANEPDCPIYPLFPGIMFAKGTDPTGKYVILHHPERNQFTAYWHLKTLPSVANGNRVFLDTSIGVEGATGIGVTGRHTHVEVRNASKWAGNLLATGTPIDPLPFFTAQGGGQSMSFPQEISNLKVQLTKQIPMYNIHTGERVGESGFEMETRWKTPPMANGWGFFIPNDRFKSGEPFGFKDADVLAKGNTVHDTQFDPDPLTELQNHYNAYRLKAEAEMRQLSNDIIDFKIKLEDRDGLFEKERQEWKRIEDNYLTTAKAERAEYDRQLKELTDDNTNLDTQLQKALKNAKPIERLTWQEHLSRAIELIFRGGEK